MRLVGIVTVDDAMDVLQEENTEDIAKMAAVTPTDKPYLKTSIWRLCLNRLPWLLILLVSSTLSGLVISANDNVFNHLVAPVVAEIHVNIGHADSFGVEKPLKQQVKLY